VILDGHPLQRQIKNKLKEECQRLRSSGVVPSLHVLAWEREGESSYYLRNITLLGEEVGTRTVIHQMDPLPSWEKIQKLVQELNGDKSVHGILALAPIPSQIERGELGSLISPLKDVDGINPLTLGKLFLGQPLFVPSTAEAIIKLFDFYGIQIEGKRAVILGRSLTVGKPLALLLLSRNATVTVCHSFTRDLSFISRQAEILISAMGIPRKVDSSFVKEGAVVVDVGTTLVGEKVIGDVRFEEVMRQASWITPVPGGVGSVTTAVLLENLIKAVKIQGLEISPGGEDEAL